MKKTEKNDLRKELEKMEIRIRHLENELELTRQERETARRQYHEVLTRFEKKVDERTRQLIAWQSALRGKRQELRRIIDFSPVLIFYLDDRHRFTRVNREFARALGLTSRRIVGRTSGELFPAAAERLHREEEAIVNGARSLLDKHIQLECDGRALHLLLSRIPQIGLQGEVTGIIGFGIDVTSWRQSEQEKRQLENQLRMSEKLSAIGLVAGGVAHDLNNMLSAIVCYPDLILNQLPADSQAQRAVRAMQKSGEKAAAIVHDLLTLTRRGLAIDEVVSLNQVISHYFASPEFEKLKSFHPGIEFAVDLAAELGNVRGSPVHLSSAVMNLVSNAAEAISGHGFIRIGTRNLRIDQPLVFPDLRIPPGIYTTLTVSDNGVGIPAADHKRIFEPFYTKKTMGSSGTGLGMAVVWSTVQDHHGYIHLKSAPGCGTTFDLYLPSTPERLPQPEETLPITNLIGHHEHILVVDDSPDQLDMAAAVLNNLGYSVTTAASGEKAVEIIRRQPADLLLLNMIMDPGIDGLETYRRILRIHPQQRAIIVSGFSETDQVREARRLGAGDFVKKPYTVEKLMRAVRSELDRSAN
jgi:two-component system, cell cycle sensor histidine kinase and response regulator CckA